MKKLIYILLVTAVFATACRPDKPEAPAAIRVASISVTPATLALEIGDSKPLTTEVMPADAADKSVTWETSDPKIATVSPTGEVTTIAAGTATITATADGKSDTSTITVAEPENPEDPTDPTDDPEDPEDPTDPDDTIDVTFIILNRYGETITRVLPLDEGESEKLKATIAPENATDKTLTWASSDENIATVDQEGKITAHTQGMVKITATATTPKSNPTQTTVTVNVYPPQPAPPIGGPIPNSTLFWIYDAPTKTLTISGSGAIPDYDIWEYRPWHALGAEIKTVIIDDDVTAIGRQAFGGCVALTTINLSKMDFIASQAFAGCEALTTIDLSSVRIIEQRAFNGCAAASSVKLGPNLTEIGDDAFAACTALANVYIEALNPPTINLLSGNNFSPNTDDTDKDWLRAFVTIIDTDGNFVNRDGTTGGPLPNSTTAWELTPDGTLTISGTGDMPGFDYPQYRPWNAHAADITTVIIPDGVTSIGRGAFDNCSNLTSVTIPSSVKTIGDFAFNICPKLANVTIPDGVTTIGDSAFKDCTSFTSITIPNSVTIIDDEAFLDCTNLESITIGSGIERIMANVFNSCTKLKDVYILAENPPTLGTMGNFSINNEDTLHVPAGSVDLYKEAVTWKDVFAASNIIPIVEP
ncbi:MAG: leucine-rich repeat protein [Alistipes sp.]|jgi:hypothetical protein|nr:leucine-rich repeat protein [Alistipes sp.]